MPSPFPDLRAAACPVGTGLPRRAGVGFKPQHIDALLADGAAPAFVEVHAENYMGAGGAPHAQLTRVRERMPVSLHGVGLSIGAEGPPDAAHLDRLARLIERYQPAAFSEHLAWSTHGDVFFNDLLPLTYDKPTFERVCAHVAQVQERLGLRMLLENPSTYFEFAGSTMSEPEFIAGVVERTGCGLLLDVNNVHVSCRNNHRDAIAYLAALPLQAVTEIHLAGYAEEIDADGGSLLVDDHGAPVAEPVWALYAQVLVATGPVPTLIEWDNAVPGYARLRAEAQRADQLLDTAHIALSGLAA
ncbi:MAG: DUF692 domain-containing protein [Gammaproteobacteria bacterium]|nr:DUF692 domain-containing protein [Gammaproteobacteria bacterium]